MFVQSKGRVLVFEAIFAILMQVNAEGTNVPSPIDDWTFSRSTDACGLSSPKNSGVFIGLTASGKSSFSFSAPDGTKYDTLEQRAAEALLTMREPQSRETMFVDGVELARNADILARLASARRMEARITLYNDTASIDVPIPPKAALDALRHCAAVGYAPNRKPTVRSQSEFPPAVDEVLCQLPSLGTGTRKVIPDLSYNLTISADGRLAKFEPIAGAGVPTDVQNIVGRMLVRLTFIPATDADGRPVPTTFRYTERKRTISCAG
jgi:hypothetical protein